MSANVDRILGCLNEVKREGPGQWVARCPAHRDRTPSLSVSEGDNGRVLVYCHGGCETSAVLAALELSIGDLFAPVSRNGSGRGEIQATYDYVDEDGNLLFQVVRFVPKDFRQRRPDGRDGWIWNLDGTRRVLYRLPEITEAIALGKLVHVVEGEKDVHAIERVGGIATTNPGGAKKWGREYPDSLRGARVRIVADRDGPGQDHAIEVARSLDGVAASVDIVQARTGKDSADHLSAGLSLDDFDPAKATEAQSARPEILIRDELNSVTNEAIAAIAARNDLGVYVRGRALVTVARTSSAPSKWLRRPNGAPVIVPILLPRLLGLMDDAASWEKRSERTSALKPSRPPEWVAKQILGRLEWPFRHLEAVIEAPTIRPDGSVLSAIGWDEATGLLLERAPEVEWPSVPDAPTPTDVRDAVETIIGPVADFPFVAESDKAAFVSAVISLVCRHLIDGPVPGFPIRAPTPGTGKTLLADVIGIIGTGRAPAAMSMTHQTDEFRKRVLAIAVDGTPLVLLENVSGSLGSDVLAAALTATEWKDRLLGHTEMITAPLRPVWIMTGNNFGFRRTLGRRVVPIDLDAKIETPEDREGFAHADLRAHVRVNRPEIVIAVLTIVRAFHLAGRPRHSDTRMGSFEAWDDLVRSAVIWAGLDDPATTAGGRGRARIRAESDDDLEATGTLLEALHSLFPTGRPFSTAEVFELAKDDPELRAVLHMVAPTSKGGPATPNSLGATFRENRDRPIRRLVLRRAKRKWKVERTGEG